MEATKFLNIIRLPQNVIKLSNMADQQTVLPIIFILGPPGAGKSYLCKQAAKEISGIKHVIISDLLRAEKDKAESPWAEEILAKMPLGVHVSSQDHTKSYLLDGFPRNIEQAEAFLAKMDIAKATISLNCPKDVLLERLQKRDRADDDPKIAKNRYDSHVDQTVPAIDYLEENGVHVVNVSSEQEGEEGWRIFKDALLVSQPQPCARFDSSLTVQQKLL
ncbi:MAG: hypothetical protein Q9198_006939 [Flavoplaca austrocitrina]